MTASVVALAIGTAGSIPFGQRAQAAFDPATDALGAAIEELGTVIAVGTSVQELAEALPLTGVAPAASDGLAVLTSLQTALASLRTQIADAGPPASIEPTLEGADQSLPGGVEFAVGDVVVSDDAGVVDYTIPLTLTRTVSVPVLFESSVFDMAGSTIEIEFELSTSLALRFDTNLLATDPGDAFSLRTAPVFSLTASAAAASDITAATRIGVTDATATLAGLALDAAFSVPLVDPDGAGGITRDEWMNTQVSDLVGDVARTGSIAGSLSLDTSLIAGTPDAGPVSIADSDLADGYSFTLPDLGDIADFSLISPAAIIAGIGQASAGIGGAQTVGDVDLPFVGGTVRRIAQASRPILDVVDALGVICGTTGADNAVPTGSVEDLASGTPVYCRAVVTTGVQAGSITWTAPNATEGANTSGADADTTLGLTPTENAVFTTSADGDFDVSAAYTATFDDDNDGSADRTIPRTSTQPPMSVQGLAERFVELGDFDVAAEDLFAFDASTHALTADLSMTIDPDPVSLPINVGSQLESETGIAGLQTTSGDLTADAGDVSIDLTAGVFLLPPDEWDTVHRAGGGCPDPSITDLAECDDALNLFFVGVDPTAPEFAVADASFVANSPTLSGQLGFLEVTAEADPFQLTRADDTAPVISVELNPSGVMDVGGTPVPNAIPLRELLFDITGRTEVSPLNLAFEGNFEVTASLDGAEVASAGVGVTWDPVLVGSPTITPDADFDGAFQNFNPVPNLFGTATNATPSATVLDASGASFGASAVGARVTNLSDGSSCEVTSQTATTLTCAEGLAGVAGSEWNSGDLYRLEVGSPLAMLETLLDNLDQIVAAIDNVSGAGLGEALDTELPIVGVSPRALLGQIQDIRRTIEEIRQPAASIVCGTAHSGGAVTGDPSEVVYGAGGTATIYCNATHNKPASSVTWSVSGAAGTATPPADPTTTVAAMPSDVVTITFTGGTEGDTLTERTNDADGYQIDLAFSDVDGPHDAEYPSRSQPNSIQQLEQAIKDKLGAGNGFGLSIEDVGGTDVVVLDLSVGRCNDETLCPGAANAGALTTPLNADVEGLGGLVSANSDGDVSVAYDANARLKLGFALSTASPQVYVMPDTGIELQGQFSAVGLDFEAALGPFSVVAGESAFDDNGTPDDTSDDVGKLGTVHLGAQLSVGDAITAPVPIGDFLGDLGTYLAPTFESLPDQTCGTIVTDKGADPDSPDDDTTHELTGLGCAAISIALKAGDQVNYVADLGLTVDIVSGEFVITPHIPTDLTDALLAAALDLRLLLAALPEVIGSVESALRASGAAAAGNNKVPLIGDALDAGADVAGKLREVTQAVVDNIPAEVYEATTVEGAESALQTFIYNQLSPTGLLRTSNGEDAADAADDVWVEADCGGCDKTAAGSTLSITDMRVIFGVGQEADTELPFDLGMDGVPLRLAGSLAPHVSWSFIVDLGLSRTEGPYIGISDPGGSVRPDEELTLNAGIGLGDAAAECPDFEGAPLDGNWSTTKCLGGQIAFLGVNVADNDDNPTGLDLTAALDLTNGSEGTISIGNAGDMSLEPTLQIDANVDLGFRTGIVGGQEAGFPSVIGHIALGWGFGLVGPDAGNNRPLEITFDQLYLDISPLVENFLDPILTEIRRFTGPFQPIIDTLTAPIPVVSDLAEMVGQPPVTMLGLMQLISGNDLTLIQSIAAFITFINDPVVGNGYFSLSGTAAGGSFGVDIAGARQAQGPTSAASLVKNAVASANSLLSQDPIGGDGTSTLKTRSTATPPATKANLPGTFGVPGLTFPFLDNPSQIFGLLMGQDITLVRYDFGPLEASAGFSYNFPPIMVGPVPIAIGVGGSVTVRGRFAVGYDTSGLRKVLSGGSGMYLFDGIFIDDLDVNGVDVPEVSFIGEVYAQAAVSVVIASAGIVAGLRITVDLNLNDSPEPDGKLRIEEIFNKLQNPICLFDVSGKLEAFIKAFVELNLFITSIRFDFTILEIELLNFAGGCTPPKPRLANNDGGTLKLNIGDRANLRNVSTEVKDEDVTVRPINEIGGYSVSAFGVYQTFGPGGEFDTGTAITAISANAADGNDTIKLLPGKDQEEAPEAGTGAPEDASIAFTAAATINGGTDNDVIQGGEGADTLNGEGGNDRLNGGGGGDTLNGGADVDTLNGESGNDFLYGEGGTDQLQGGAGNDVADGGADADLVQGGPGTDQPGGTDGDDTLIGGTGPDTVEGGTGGDHVYGDEQIGDDALCANDTADPGLGDEQLSADKVSGGGGDDVVFGGHGPDEMYGGSGSDLLCGNQGADTIEADAGAATTATDTNSDPQVDTSGGDDTAYGGSGNDTVAGNFGHDFLLGNTGSDLVGGGPGNDDVSGGLGNDRVNGDDGVDVIVGDDAGIAQVASKSTRTDPATLVANVSNIGTGSGGTANCGAASDSADTALADCIRGGGDRDLIFGEGGNDDIDAGDGGDLVFANDGADNPVRGGAGNDVMYGNAGNDVMYGDSGADVMYGNADADDLRGGLDDDLMEGNEAADTIRGEAGQDDLIGGSSNEAVSDGGDLIDGGALADVIVGDNGTITRPGGNDPSDATVLLREVTIFDVGAAIGGADSIFGELANDRIYAGNFGDSVSGGAGQDVIDGNGGADAIDGNDGDDRIAGGSSTRTTLRAPGLTLVAYDEAPDTGDTINGNAGADVIAGDNARVNTDGTVVMTAFGGASAFGNDLVNGNDGQDRIYGQLGGDQLSGNADEDYVVGDLGNITPGTPNGFWPGGAPRYDVSLELAPDLGGADTVDGGTHDDHLFGVAGADLVRGGTGDDYIEGNGGSDALYGQSLDATTTDSDQDDMIGGSSSWTRPTSSSRADAGENLMQGNADRDVMTGDNADIVRETTAGGSAWAPDEVIAGARKRTVTLLDREKSGAGLAAVSGDDRMQGNDGSDRMFGEGGNDLVQGNAADDLIEGNQADDWLEGNAGEDDVIGGSNLLAGAGGVPLAGSGPDLGDPDGADAIFGGVGADVTIGDNAVVVRKTAANTATYNAALAATGAAAPYFTTDPADTVPGWWLGVSTHRLVRLLDRASVNSGRFGADVVSGGAGADVLFGQDGDDLVTGGREGDTAEGNGSADQVYGDRAPEAAVTPPVYSAGLLQWAAFVSAPADRDGTSTVEGEDDLVGGSNVVHRDAGDHVEGDGEDDFQLGDNGTLQRQISGGQYVDAQGDGAHTRIFRRANRLGVASATATVYGNDVLWGNNGDDAVWGQEGNDDIRGHAGDDDLFGELGNDLIYGGLGEDAMVGDRGAILNTTLGDSGALFTQAPSQASYNGPPFFSVPVKYFTTGRYDRRVDLAIERAGSVGGPFPGSSNVTLASNGQTTGGLDTMRGGPGHDSIHGGFDDDLINGDSGGDFVFGDNGSDVLWGGRGNDDGTADQGTDRALIDRVFGGRGGNPNQGAGIVTGGADIIDYKPRTTGPNIDPPSWVAATSPYDDGAAGGSAVSQSHHGTDWIYGGWDRDVMEADQAAPGPNDGDRLWDWSGAYNLYTHCNANYGGYNDQRTVSPQMIGFLEQLAYDSGVGSSLADVQNSSSSAYDELALVYTKDVKNNSGKAYPTTPGHFDQPTACDPA